MKLTQRQIYSAASLTNLIHIVVTGDTSQNPAGSSYAIPLEYVVDLVPSSGGGTFSGGTVSGATIFANGLSATTISATTYQNLPSSTFSGGTVSGPTIFANGLTATTISATTIIGANISDALISVFDGLIANNTSSATTLVLNYGVNVIQTATTTNFAAKLPQPVTGKKVTVVNKTTTNVFLYPSNAGGQINNYVINAPAIIPPDGKAYDFTCIENPLPGAWTWTPPAINQFDSGEISVTTSGTNQVIMAVDSTANLVTSAPSYESFASYDSINSVSPVSSNGVIYYTNTNALSFKPSGPNWNGVTRIKVYTNISSNITGSTPQFRLSVSYNTNQYDQADNSFLNASDGGAGSGIGINLTSAVPGTVPPAGLTANVGDAGTLYGIFEAGVDFTPTINSSIVGDAFLGSGTFVFGMTTYNTFDYQSVWVCGNLLPYTIGNVKFRYFLEYN